MGENPDMIFNVGCPATDLLLSTPFMTSQEVLLELNRKTRTLNIEKPFILVVQHPVTTEYGNGAEQILETLYALKDVKEQVLMLWPNSDAGSEDMVTATRTFLLEHKMNHFFLYRHFRSSLFVNLMRHCRCMVGNSSSGIIETPTFKIPCVNIGSRQKGRLRADNVIDVGYDKERIKTAIRYSLQDTEFKKKVQNIVNPYGEGGTSKRVVEILKEINLDKQLLQKKMSY
jgi:UDP-hydrolysing UDP-N-acetyl-D-glucosamine 2-epimerase